MSLKHIIIAAFSAALIAAPAMPSLGAGKAVIVTKDQLVWKNLGAPGLEAAVVSGDMQKGPSQFFLKYPVGFVTPSHHHSTDHYATIVSGSVTLTTDGKSQKLGPGSYFALTGKIPHVAKVEGSEPVVFLIQADGPWDVVMAK